jgi:hypothetical protein
VPAVHVAIGLAVTWDALLPHAAASLDALRAEVGLEPDPGCASLRRAPCLTLTPGALEEPPPPGPPGTLRFREAEAARRPLPDWWPGMDGPLST